MQEKDRRYLFPAFVVLMVGGVPAFSQIGDLDGKRVLSVVYVPERQPLASEDLARLQQLSAGSTYTAKDVAETIDRLFATGAYSDIQVDVDRQPAGLAVKFLTQSAQGLFLFNGAESSLFEVSLRKHDAGCEAAMVQAFPGAGEGVRRNRKTTLSNAGFRKGTSWTE